MIGTIRKIGEAWERGRENRRHQVTGQTVTATAITYSPKCLKGTTCFIILHRHERNMRAIKDETGGQVQSQCRADKNLPGGVSLSPPTLKVF